MITRSTSGSRSFTALDGVTANPSSCIRSSSATFFALNARLPVKISNSTSSREDVAADRHLAARELLRRHIGRRARADVVDFIGDARQPEIRDAHPPLAIDHHVRGLQVAVQHALFVRRRESRAQLTRDLDRPILREPSDPPQQRRQILPIDMLHRQEDRAVGFADVVDAADVAVRHLTRDAHFVVELREADVVARHRFRKELGATG